MIRRGALALVSLALVAAGTAVGIVVTAPTAAALAYTTIDHTVVSSARYAERNGVSAGVAVLDERTGKYYGAGHDGSYYGSASVMKLFVATKLLVEGQMQGSTASTAYSMITRSDDNALERLLPMVGGTSVIDWVGRRYGISIGRSSYKSWCWGNTQITARGIVEFYAHMQRDRRVAPWLMNALHHHAIHGADGTNQSFGIPSAAAPAAVKQGWGQCSSDTGGSVINTTGVVNGDRFAVAILTNTNRWGTDSRSYNSTQASVVTAMARILMPHGDIDLPETHNPFGHVDAVRAAGSTVTVTGWADDPDSRNSPSPVDITEGRSTVWAHRTAVYRKDVNRARHLSGNHGFTARFAARNGTHEYCVHLVNTGQGNTSPTYCYRVRVNGSPVGKLTSLTTSGQHVLVSGWAYDPDSVPAASDVAVTVDPTSAHKQSWTFRAAAARALGTYPVPGNHGFDLDVVGPSGSHQVCVYALNTGPVANAASTLACRTVILTAPVPPPSSSSNPTPGPSVPTTVAPTTTTATGPMSNPPTGATTSAPATTSASGTSAATSLSSATGSDEPYGIGGDGGIAAAVNRYRTAAGLPALTVAFGQGTQDCAVHHASGPVPACHADEAWATVPHRQDGSSAATLWFAEGTRAADATAPPSEVGRHDDYAAMMNPSAVSATYGWAYDPGTDGYEVTMDVTMSPSPGAVASGAP